MTHSPSRFCPPKEIHTPARQVVSPSGSIVRGRFPSAKAGRMVAFESLLERDALILLDLSPSVTHIKEQPFTLHYPDGERIRRYTPDFALELIDDSVLILEVKPAAKLVDRSISQRFRLIALEMEKGNHRFQIITDQEIRREPRLSNLKLLHRYLFHPTPENLQQQLCQQREPLPLGCWFQRLGSQATALAAIAAHLLIFDPDQPLQIETPVWAYIGGNTHVSSFL
ncbi:TnsA endonuclease N-terminal domain-containing protein [Laribacter hongkongensis]|uniref:TnsA endonuclease N-terminal domain-containing protein n=1 Tax=Laribacter hongkongensis TaxID=168471 RepID=UPI001EFCBF5B|nr:TnsA endonuclease N-terminal domain-containing protein [Laribacter hongkongensis]MCG8996080.1 TnsA endonuclease N-terminal domain-containing protein [Laribacter hongkongensis]MCG9010991.1 TnsA endonuclease N-terminal domain-containing protein [Laribacter hongkongensis]MCG9023435.1 TnsA endonuclease N-terminal domain-containing protein [Laribacter hongkongensis]MCG9047805.1 TnsA endonuclease N-terminal domain-containing protein [Laribacter hongkongensis]MCG9074831.1 TnsA endonuclease N-termi